MNFPKLFGKPSSGTKVKQWEIEVIKNDNNTSSILRKHGYIDHKIMNSEKIIDSGKNIGKKNETSTFEQACKEAEYMWKKQKESGYVENMDILYEKSNVTILPMLAHDFNKRSKDISNKVAFQPKIDGIRMIASLKNGKVVFYSRTGKEVNGLDHIRNELFESNILSDEDFYIDGEIFTFDLPFEEISGLFRTIKHDDKQKAKIRMLKYHIFDCFNTRNKLTFKERYNIISTFPKMKQVVVVKTKTFENLDKPLMYYVDFLHEKYVQEGYEGLIIRNSESCYVLNYRSKDLQKYKQFIDEEYEIVSGKEATGEDAGTVIFECKTPGDIIFSVRPRGSRELRKYMLQNLKNYIGKKLTVRYQNLSERNVPRFPVGITVRDYE